MFINLRSPLMLELLREVERYAPSAASVLITGESGVGKESVARWLHDCSARARLPYVRVNCAALTETLIESELFGHESGSFTGAHQTRVGRFELAGQGTLFLDEVGELSLRCQAKLLRALEEREYERVGGNSTMRFEARVVSATNRNLDESMRLKDFRLDLYHRLGVFLIHVPALRDRPDDIPGIALTTLQRLRQESETQVESIAPEALEWLQDQSWPGNIRQLRNLLHAAAVLTIGPRIEAETLRRQTERIATGFECSSVATSKTLEEIEHDAILDRLKVFNGNKTLTARDLGVTPRTIRNKLRSDSSTKSA
jgi:two-component system, NtrC family, response regulator HydG